MRLCRQLGLIVIIFFHFNTGLGLAQNLNCPGRWINNYCICPNGQTAGWDYSAGYLCAPVIQRCRPGSYPVRNKCVLNGYALCPSGDHACPVSQKCTFSGCVPKELEDFQVCPDGKSYCERQGQMCLVQSGGGGFSCKSRFEFMREKSAHNERIRKLWVDQLREELRDARTASSAEWMKEGALLGGQAGVDVLSGAAADALAPGWGSYYKSGAQAVTDVAIGAKPSDQAAGDWGVDSTATYLGFGTPKLMHDYYNKYKDWWRSKPN